MAERPAGLSPRQRLLAVIGGAVVLLAGTYFLFLRDSGGPEPFSAGPTPTTRSTRSPTPRTPATPTPTQSSAPESFDGFGGRDPFLPLVGEAPPPASGSPGPQPSPGATGGPRSGQRVELLDIFTQNGTRFATVEVDNQQYTVKKGDRFAGSYKVLSLSSSCGTFAFGDERFTLCIGQEVLK